MTQPLHPDLPTQPTHPSPERHEPNVPPEFPPEHAPGPGRHTTPEPEQQPYPETPNEVPPGPSPAEPLRFRNA